MTIFFILMIILIYATTIYVDANVVGGVNSDSTRIDAYQYLAETISCNGISAGDEICVAVCVYYPEDHFGSTNDPLDELHVINL